MSDDTPTTTEYFDESVFSMSDEEFMSSIHEGTPHQQTASQEEDTTPSSAEEDSEEVEETPDVTQDTDDEESEEEDTEENSSHGEEEEEEPSGEPEQEESEEEEDTSEEEVPDDSGIDYKAEYERLMAPFKASGRTMQVKSVDEAIQLMQMGVDYSKRVRAMKPHLRLIKMLENHQLLDEEKLSYLIDLSQNNVAAINKLLRDSKVDPMDIDLDKDSDYRPSKRVVDDREIELDMVMEELRDSPNFNQTLHVVSKQWDSGSKRVIAENPQLLKTIDSHIGSGIYSIIQEEMERQRTFGRLDGMSDLEAYRTVGDSIQAQGGFNHLFSDQRQEATRAPAKRKVIPPNASKATDTGRNERKRAASPAKASSTAPTEEVNYLAMSGEEFRKTVGPNIL